MKVFTTTKALGLALPVDKDVISGRFNQDGTLFYPVLHGHATTHPIQLPFPCTFLGLSHELSEQEAQQVIELDLPGETALNELQGLLLSLGLDPKEQYAILINTQK